MMTTIPNYLTQGTRAQWEAQRMARIYTKAMLHWMRKREPEKAARAARDAAHYALLVLGPQKGNSDA